MSCGGSCNCGDNCNCGGGSKMYPDLVEKVVASDTLILGVAPEKISEVEVLEMAAPVSSEGCNCGPNCSCDPCNC